MENWELITWRAGEIFAHVEAIKDFWLKLSRVDDDVGVETSGPERDVVGAAASRLRRRSRFSKHRRRVLRRRSGILQTNFFEAEHST